MSAERALSANDPLRIAFSSWQLSEEYANTRRWGLQQEHLKGSLWAAFVEGWNRRGDTGSAAPAVHRAEQDPIIVELVGALKSARGLIDTPVSRRKIAGNEFYDEVCRSIRSALAAAEKRGEGIGSAIVRGGELAQILPQAAPQKLGCTDAERGGPRVDLDTLGAGQLQPDPTIERHRQDDPLTAALGQSPPERGE